MRHNKAVNGLADINEVLKTVETLKYEFQKAEMSANRTLFGMLKDVTGFKAKLMSGQQTINCGKMATDIERRLSSFKTDLATESRKLESMEGSIEEELKLMNSELIDCERTTVDRKARTVNERNENSNCQNDSLKAIKIQIDSIDSEIEKNGGRDCGWMKVDHDDFMKLFVKKGRNPRSKAFREALLKSFPLFSPEAINSHVERFVANEELMAEKKALVARYKRFQQEHAKVELESMKQVQTDDVQNKELIRQQALIAREREERAKQLADWRLAKEKEEKEVAVQKRREEARLKEVFELTKAREETQRKEKQELIQRYKESRELKRMMSAEQKMHEERLRRAAIGPDDINRIKMKEEQLVRRREELKARKVQPVIERQERLGQFFERAESRFDYLENNVTNTTVAQLKKQTRKFDFERDDPKFGDNFAGNLVRIEGRKLAEWRQVA